MAALFKCPCAGIRENSNQKSTDPSHHPGWRKIDMRLGKALSQNDINITEERVSFGIGNQIHL